MTIHTHDATNTEQKQIASGAPIVHGENPSDVGESLQRAPTTTSVLVASEPMKVTEKNGTPEISTEDALSEEMSDEEEEDDGNIEEDEYMEDISVDVDTTDTSSERQCRQQDDDDEDVEEEIPETSIGLTETTRLKQYQWMGFNWLRANYLEKKSCILADDMGLGKTIQTLSLLTWIKKNSKKRVQFLIIVPLSTLENWGKEAEKFTHLSYILFHGNKERIGRLKSDMKKNKHDMVVTTYEIFRKYYTSVARKKWEVTVFDEGHRLKSYASGNDPNAFDPSKKMKMSRVAERSRQLHCIFKLILSGTPLQNSPMELWSLLNLLNPETFTESTRQSYNELTHDNFRTIQKDIEPYILRRTKNIMNSSGKLPPKTEKIIRVDLTLVQKTLYRAVLERNSSFLLKQFKSIPALNILQKNLLRICMHPYLLNRDSSVEAYVKEKNPTKSEEDLLVESSSKLIVVDKLLKHIIEEKKEKVLIFCTMLKTLDLLEDYMESRGYEFRRFDGGTPGEKRYKMIEEFQNDNSIPVFLLSSKAGGIGINLTAANHVILYNSDYNPTTETQALSRAHRIGQSKEVKIYRLVCRQTVEEGILQIASRRQGVHELMLDSGETQNKNKKLTNEEIEEILKCGVQDQLKSDSIQDCGDKLLSVDLNEILENAITVSSAVDVRKKYFADNSDEQPSAEEQEQKTDAEKAESGNFWTSLFPDYIDVEILKGRFDNSEQFDEQNTIKFFNDLHQVHNDLDDSATPGETKNNDKNLDGLVSIKNKSQKNVDMHRVNLRMRNSLHSLLLQVNRTLAKKFPSATDQHKELVQTTLRKLSERTLRSRKRKRYDDAEDAGGDSKKPKKKKNDRDPTFVPPPEPTLAINPTNTNERKRPKNIQQAMTQKGPQLIPQKERGYMAGDAMRSRMGFNSGVTPSPHAGPHKMRAYQHGPPAPWKRPTSGPLLRPASVEDMLMRDFSKSLVMLAPTEPQPFRLSAHRGPTQR
eukprot:CAMPEP_0117437668 /NCGR_PEP_ID=MMETSP0759-20121206/1650_1 /TAXON_ID=63605 /ORGANISM="Percolomonas cosmopolitus, Strain WS" /LENGTH=982 /DNA_ID=CAMNT_0005229323 /DNA_START=287 /DNA_END=3235 /DNA_ORIENTATION=+